jgi:hypothetical protein
VLRAAGEPLYATEIAKRVIESGRCSGLKGKTPEATLAALLAVGSKPGGPFKRIDKATYTLADDGAEAAAESKKMEPKPRPQRAARADNAAQPAA